MSFNAKSKGREPWLGLIYDKIARKEWADRSEANENDFNIDKASGLKSLRACIGLLTFV